MLTASGPESREIVLLGNDLTQVRQPYEIQGAAAEAVSAVGNAGRKTK